MQALSKRVLNVQEEERRALSRELHDDIGQCLAALKIGLLRISPERGADEKSLLGECLGMADLVLDKVRRIALDLRPPQLDQLGLADALEWLVEHQRSATGLRIELACSGFETRRAPPALENACYRIAQEAINNASRHAKAKVIRVRLESNGRLLKLAVHDDGVGFDEAMARDRARKTGSLGLTSMEERAQLAGGRLRIRSVMGSGTNLSAIFPLGPDADEASQDAGIAAQ
jgi:signal transduction histidine kinase